MNARPVPPHKWFLERQKAFSAWHRDHENVTPVSVELAFKSGAHWAWEQTLVTPFPVTPVTPTPDDTRKDVLIEALKLQIKWLREKIPASDLAVLDAALA